MTETTNRVGQLSEFVVESLAGQRPTRSKAQVEFLCPACGHTLRANASCAGGQGRCPACRIEFRVPDHVTPAWLRD